jgi:hypothetical protein
VSDRELERPILIGGCGSSGTTLLYALLASHPRLAGGPELSFFNKRALYDDWAGVRERLPRWLEQGVPTGGYHVQPAFLEGRGFHGLEDARLVEWSRAASGLRDFVQLLEAHVLTRLARPRLVEKSPTNVYCLRELTRLLPEARVLHVVRDGRDVVCSLLGRGFSLFQAASRWLYDVSAGFACRDLPQLLEVRYEELVRSPAAVLRRVCEHCELEFHPSMLERAGLPEPFQAGLPSWRSSPVGPIAECSVGRHERELDASQLARFHAIGLTPFAAARLGTRPFETGELLAALGYAMREDPGAGYPREAVLDPVADHAERLRQLREHGEVATPPLMRIRLAPEAGHRPRPDTTRSR